MYDWQEIVPDGSIPPESIPDGVDPEDFYSALDTIRDACGWHVFPQISQTVTLEASHARVLNLPTRFFLRPSLVVKVDGVQLVEKTDYSVLPLSCQLCRITSGYFGHTLWHEEVEVTMTHGFEHLPRAILGVAKSVCESSALGVLAQMTAGPFNITPPRGSEGGAASLNDYQLRALAPYMLGESPW